MIASSPSYEAAAVGAAAVLHRLVAAGTGNIARGQANARA
jgi:hypothetical protein